MSEIQSFGFPNAHLQQKAFIPSQPPVTSKGRWLIGMLLLVGVGYISYSVWDSYFRHAAYGVVNSKIVEVSAPYDCVIVSLQVGEGDRVAQGQVLAIVENFEYKSEHESARDKLSVASAELNAQVSRMKLDYAFHLDATTGTIVAYYDLLGRLAQEQSKVDETRDIHTRSDRLLKSGAVSAEEVSALRYRLGGHEKNVRELKEGIVDAKQRIERLQKLYDKSTVLESWQEQLRPFVKKVEQATADIDRVKAKLELGKVLAPASGVVVKRHQYAGEQSGTAKTLFSIVEDNTAYITLYVQQEATKDFKEGDVVGLLSPTGDISCTVERIGDRYEPAPDSIKRFYKASQNLLPIYMKMNEKYDLKYGATVKLPYFRR